MARPGPWSLPVGRLAQRLRSAAGQVAVLVRRAMRTPVARIGEVIRRIRHRAPDASRGDRTRRLARRLSIGVTALLAGASAAGLAWKGLYQDPAATAAMFRGYDLGSLAVAVPVMAGALARNGSARAELIRAGMLAYVVYTYAYYVLGAAFNAVFFVHAGLWVLAAVALALTLASTDVRAVAERFGDRTPTRVVSAALAVLATSLGAMWTYYSLRFALTRAAPPEGLLLQPPPIHHLGYAMDLATLVPGYAAAAVLLWRRRAWGYVLATVLLTASSVVQVDYMLALVFQAAARLPGATAFDPQEPYIAATIAAAAAALLANLHGRPATVPA